MIKKFRGKFTRTNEYVYGYFFEDEDGQFIRSYDGNSYEVYSVAQFCGYDKNGKELYEGDIVADGNDDFKISLKMDWEYYSPGREKNFVLKKSC